MNRFRELKPVLPILLGAAVMLALSLGIRQTFGIFVQPLTKDLAITVSDYTLALSIQNLGWGLMQPFAGALVTRVGYRPVMVTGAIAYAIGLALMGLAGGKLLVMLGAGVFIGAALACSASSMAQAVAARVVPSAVRSLILGLMTAAGSAGAIFAAPLGQWATTEFGWRAGVLAVLLLSLAMIPAAWFAGRVDRTPLQRTGAAGESQSAWEVTCAAFSKAPFVVMMAAYFVCGMQLLFITIHLPSYLDLCGADPMLAAQALSVIAVFNIFGSIFFGWAGGHWPKLVLLGMIYLLRSLMLAWFFMSPPTAASTLSFAAIMGFLWFGVSPLVAGSVIEMFGLRWQAMVQGIAFTSHQLGSFAGAFGGGVILDTLGSYDLAWKLAVGIGLVAGTMQVASGIIWRHPGARAA